MNVIKTPTVLVFAIVVISCDLSHHRVHALLHPLQPVFINHYNNGCSTRAAHTFLSGAKREFSNGSSKRFRSIDYPPLEDVTQSDGSAGFLNKLFSFKPNSKTQNMLKETRMLKDRSYCRNEPFENEGLTTFPSIEDMVPPELSWKYTYWVSSGFRVLVLLGSFLVFPMLMEVLEEFITIEPDKLQTITQNFLPGISVLYGTFMSVSLSILYSRQQEIQDLVNKEANLISSVALFLMTLFKMDTDRAIRAGQCIADQIRILVKESRGTELLCIIYSDPYARVVELLDEAEEEVFHGNPDISIHSDLINVVRDHLKDLNAMRASRLSSETMVLPPTHFFIMGSLTLLSIVGVATSTLVAEAGSNYESAALFSVITGTYVLFYNFLGDLNNPFRGVYQIRRSSAVSHLLQTKFFLVNHPLLQNEIDFNACDDYAQQRLWTPGIGEIPLE